MNLVPISSRYTSSIEPLESRIAPARVILVGAPDFPNKGDTNYSDTTAKDGGPGFVDTEVGIANGDKISQAVGPGVVGKADTFYFRLSAGDVLELYTGQDTSEPLLTVTSGNVVAFFIDNVNDPNAANINEVQQAELVSLALGKDAGVILRGGISGDIVTNLNEHGTKSLADDELDMMDLVSSKQGIKGIIIGTGATTGKILSGGDVANVSIFGGVKSILAGSAALTDPTFDFFPGIAAGVGNPGGEGTLVAGGPGVAPLAGENGPSISKVTLNDNLIDKIQAGDGGAGAKGGSLSQIVINSDTTGFTLQAGKGGEASGAKKNGGDGGGIKGIYVAGRSEDINNPTPNNLIKIGSGEGGQSTLGGKGGKGGPVSSVYVGFQFVGGKAVASTEVLVDDVQIFSGKGGAGKTGGDAGAIATVRGTISSVNAVGDEIRVEAGAGGDSNVVGTGKTGIGGSIRDVDLRNLAFTVGIGAPGTGSSILVKAGSGGVALGAGGSAKGGSIRTATLLGSDLKVTAGDGSTGKIGGDGGFLQEISILEGDNVLAHNLSIQAGKGGTGAAGNGGKGGDLLTVRIDNGDFDTLDLNPNDGGRGGDGTGGKGGKGGMVKGVTILDTDTGFNHVGTFNLHSGLGGSGLKGGADGGSISGVTFTAEGLTVVAASGAGGSTLNLPGAKGNGGAGGILSSIQIATTDLNPIPTRVDATITSGAGGNAIGSGGKGGRGGNMLAVSARALGNVSLTAGNGGNGDGGAAGAGGDLIAAAAFASGDNDPNTLGNPLIPNVNGLLQAGNAGGQVGALGAKAANGGSILGGSADKLAGNYADDQVTVQAGNGSHGGNGGSIKFLGYGSTSLSLTPTPAGAISVKAGNGDAFGKAAGKGGSIDTIAGSVSSGAFQTQIIAGVGGGNADKAADGGSISNLNLFLGGGVGAEVLIEAGDAGVGGANVSKGTKGGNVTGVQISSIDINTIIRHISAGAGGNAAKTGGVGGTINDVRVLDHDIGVRTGLAYGYLAMGGLFAGAGGTAAAGPAGKGVAGSVTNVTATAIAAIVAGHGAAPEPAALVDFITVGTPTDLLKASEGDLNFNPASDTPDPLDPMNHYHPLIANRYATNNLVGAIVNPTATDGTRFHFTDSNSNGVYDLGEVPTDGLIVAKVFKQEHANFTPEASWVELRTPLVKNGPLPPAYYDYDNLV